MALLRRTLLVLLFLVVPLTSCASSGGRPFDFALPGTSEINVHVKNNAFTPVTIYLVRNGSKVRVGRVGAANTETFTRAPRWLMTGTEYDILVQPEGHRFKTWYWYYSTGFPVYGYYNYVVRGEPVGPENFLLELTVQNEMRMSLVTDLR